MKAIAVVLSFFAVFSVFSAVAAGSERDADGRVILRGTQYGSSYFNVHIIADGIGVVNQSGNLMISNSVVEARVCVLSNGIGLVLRNNILKCGVCVEYSSGLIIGNEIVGNVCHGQMIKESSGF